MSSKREVISLLRRCLGENATQDTIDTAKEFLPSFDTDSLVEAIVELLENRKKVVAAGGGGGLVRRSAAGSSAGGVGGGLVRKSTAAAAVTATTSLSGSTEAGSPTHSNNSPSINGSLVVGNEDDNSTALKPFEVSQLTMLLLPLRSSDEVRVSLTKTLLVIIADRNSSTKYLRYNAACLCGSLFAAKFIEGDPHEVLFELFSRMEGGVTVPEQCTAMSVIIRTAIPDAATASDDEYPFRRRLHDLILQSDVTKQTDERLLPVESRERLEELRRSGSGVLLGSRGDPLKSVLSDLKVVAPASASVNNQTSVPRTATGQQPLPPSSIGEEDIESDNNPLGQQRKNDNDMHRHNITSPSSSSDRSKGGTGAPLPPPPPYQATGFVAQQQQQQQSSRGPPPLYGSQIIPSSSSSTSVAAAAAASGTNNSASMQSLQPAPPLALVGDLSTLSSIPIEQHISHRLSYSQKEEAKVRTVYVNKLDPRITEGQLRDFLDRCGQVLRVRLCGDLIGRTKYGFVEYTASEEAQRLILKDREILGSCAIRCSIAKQPIQDVDPQMDALFDAKRGLTRACLFGFVSRAKTTTTTSSTGGAAAAGQSPTTTGASPNCNAAADSQREEEDEEETQN